MKRNKWLRNFGWGILGMAMATAGGQTLPAGDAKAGAAVVQVPVIEGTMMHTARGGGRWQSFFNAHNAVFRAANREAIWFGCGENLWRYDVAQKKIDATVTPLTHPDYRSSGSVALADDGSFAIASGWHIYLWTLKQGWSRLPQVSQIVNDHHVAFDGKGKLFVSNLQGFYGWTEGLWQLCPSPLPETADKQLVAVGEGWGQLKNAVWYDHGLEQRKVFTRGPGRSANLAGFFRVKGEAIAFYWSPLEGQSWESPTGHLYRVTPETLEELGTGEQLGLDLGSGEGFRCVNDADGKQATIESLQGKALGRITLRGGEPGKYLMLRDANGDYWLGAQRFDGHAWQAVLPPGAFDYAGDMQEGILTGRLQYAEQKGTWVDTTPELPADVKAYDAKTRTGWVKREKFPGSNERTNWEQIAFGLDGSRKIVQSVRADDRNYNYCVPRFVDGDGNWWFRGRWRWDGKLAHVYDDGIEKRDPKQNVVPPEFVLSDAGAVWQYRMDRTWARYDAANDRFEAGEPYDDFAFTLGGRTFSIPARARDKEFDDTRYLMYEKTNDKWAPLQTPFGVAAMGGKSPWVFGLPKMMVRGSRMLVATQGGIFEWDSERDLWAYLMPRGQYWACFDAQGHRVMSGAGIFNQILMYDGDPIAAGPVAAGADKLTDTLNGLLRDMDADAWGTRNSATEEMSNLLHQNPQVVGQFLKNQTTNDKLSAEVQGRIQSVLAEHVPAPAQQRHWLDEYSFNLRMRLGNSLFERMTKRMEPTFPGGYVLKLGMRFDLAQSILLTAGAEESMTIRTGGDKSCRGFLLRDNTMVYLRVDTEAKPATVTQLGMGTFGSGLDKGWNWGDGEQNGLKSIELNAAPGTEPAK